MGCDRSGFAFCNFDVFVEVEENVPLAPPPSIPDEKPKKDQQNADDGSGGDPANRASTQ